MLPAPYHVVEDRAQYVVQLRTIRVVSPGGLGIVFHRREHSIVDTALDGVVLPRHERRVHLRDDHEVCRRQGRLVNLRDGRTVHPGSLWSVLTRPHGIVEIRNQRTVLNRALRIVDDGDLDLMHVRTKRIVLP